MREYCFPYREELSEDFGRIKRPVVEVLLRDQTGQWIKVFPYVDSGADFSLFPKGVCKLLNLKLDAGQRKLIQGVSGKPAVIYLHRVEMRIGEINFSARVGFAVSERMPYLLGRLDVLEHFDIRFEEDRVCLTERQG
jgi:predicted aspartyl protease